MIKPDKMYAITVALAGIVQAVTLVKDIAQTGKADDVYFQSSIYSIFQTDPRTIADVYKGLPGIKLGLEKLISMLGPEASPMQTRYMLSLIHLQKKIFRSPKTVQTLTQRIAQTKKQVDYFHLTHPTVISNLADIYLSTISPFKFRVIIWGNQRILSAAENMEKVRALLLSGIRSTVLWRQMGGSRLQLIFFRNKIKNTAKNILQEIANSEYQT